jgi:hypothetical protein
MIEWLCVAVTENGASTIKHASTLSILANLELAEHLKPMAKHAQGEGAFPTYDQPDCCPSPNIFHKCKIL